MTVSLINHHNRVLPTFLISELTFKVFLKGTRSR